MKTQSLLSSRFVVRYLLLPCALAVQGCTAAQTVSDPNKITLRDALISTVDALQAAHEQSLKDKTNFGFYGCSVTAVFNVSASETQDNKLTLSQSSSAVKAFPVSLSASESSEATATGIRGNTVTIVLDTKYCMPNSPGLTKGGPAVMDTSKGTQKQLGANGNKNPLPNPNPVIRDKKLKNFGQ